MPNGELLALFVEDQEDRRDELRAGLLERDRTRRQKVDELIEANAMKEPEDFFHAAMVFQLSNLPESTPLVAVKRYSAETERRVQ